MSPPEIDYDPIKNIWKNISSLSTEQKRYLPEILSLNKVSTFTWSTDRYFLLAFMNEEEEERVNSFIKRKNDPYPGLISPKSNERGIAFGLGDNSKYNYFKDISVRDMYTFSIGQNCTFYMNNLNLSVNTKESGRVNYIIHLAYVITYGDMINQDNYYEYLDDLIKFSFTKWRMQDA